LRLFFFPIPQSLSRILSLTTWFSNLWMSPFVLEHYGFNHSRKFQHWIDVIMDRLVFMGSFDRRMQTKSFSIVRNIEELFFFIACYVLFLWTQQSIIKKLISQELDETRKCQLVVPATIFL
jgi:hypothetical protein